MGEGGGNGATVRFFLLRRIHFKQKIFSGVCVLGGIGL